MDEPQSPDATRKVAKAKISKRSLPFRNDCVAANAACRTYGACAGTYPEITDASASPTLEKVTAMKTKLIAISLVLAMGSASAVANAGCLKGALLGGVAGHVAGHHSLLGAGAGCAIGSHMSKKKAREQAALNAQANRAPAAVPAKK